MILVMMSQVGLYVDDTIIKISLPYSPPPILYAWADNHMRIDQDSILFFSCINFNFLICSTACAIFRLKEGIPQKKRHTRLYHNIFLNINMFFSGLLARRY